VRWAWCGSRLATGLLHLAVQRLEVFGLDPVDPVRTESRDKVHLDGRTVSGQRRVPDRHRRDVLYPVGEPLLDRPSAARFAYFSGAPLLFEFLDCLAHFSFGFAFDVAPVGPTVIQHADGDPPMLPAVVLAVVDSGCAIGGAGSLVAFACHWSRVLSGRVLLGGQSVGVGGERFGGDAAEASDPDGVDVALFEEHVHGRAAN
jgi:hypothetical protein